MIYPFGPSYASASAQVYKLFLLVSMVFCALSLLLLCRVCCILAYASLKLLSKGGSAQCFGALIFRS